MRIPYEQIIKTSLLATYNHNTDNVNNNIIRHQNKYINKKNIVIPSQRNCTFPKSILQPLQVTEILRFIGIYHFDHYYGNELRRRNFDIYFKSPNYLTLSGRPSTENKLYKYYERRPYRGVNYITLIKCHRVLNTVAPGALLRNRHLSTIILDKRLLRRHFIHLMQVIDDDSAVGI